MYVCIKNVIAKNIDDISLTSESVAMCIANYIYH